MSEDIVELKDGEIYLGRILRASGESLLFAARERGDVCVMSFERDLVRKISLGQYDIKALFESMGLIPSEMVWRRYLPEIGSGAVRILKNRIFDEIVLPDGRSFLGKTEIETPKAIYFSILLEKGIGIVEFRRDSFLGLQSARGISKHFGSLYFWWRYLSHDLRIFIKKITGGTAGEKGPERTISGWKRRIEIEEVPADLEDMIIKDAAGFRKFIRWYLFLTEQQRHSMGVRRKYPVFGMSPIDVKLIFGRPSSVVKCADSIKEYWSFEDGRAAAFYKGKLSGYTRKSREKVFSDVLANFGDII